MEVKTKIHNWLTLDTLQADLDRRQRGERLRAERGPGADDHRPHRHQRSSPGRLSAVGGGLVRVSICQVRDISSLDVVTSVTAAGPLTTCWGTLTGRLWWRRSQGRSSRP